MTITHQQRASVSGETKLTEEYQLFIKNIQLSMTLSSQIFEVVQFLLEFGSEGDWRTVAKNYQWVNIDPEILQHIAMLVCAHKYGRIILTEILPTHALQLIHYEKMAQRWNNINPDLTIKMISKVKEVARYCNQMARGRYIATLFAHGGVPCLAVTIGRPIW